MSAHSKECPAEVEKVLLDDILGAAGSEGRLIFLIFNLLAQICHGPIQMMQRDVIYTLDDVIPVPPIATPVGTGNEQPVQHHEEDSPLYIKLELPEGQMAFYNLLDDNLLPETIEDQGRTDPLCNGIYLPLGDCVVIQEACTFLIFYST